MLSRPNPPGEQPPRRSDRRAAARTNPCLPPPPPATTQTYFESTLELLPANESPRKVQFCSARTNSICCFGRSSPFTLARSTSHKNRPVPCGVKIDVVDDVSPFASTSSLSTTQRT